MSRSDDRAADPSNDDEITTDVDTAWVATIRAQLAGNHSTDGDAIGDDPDDRGQDDLEPADRDQPDDNATDGNAADWLESEPAWDPEATVGASSDLIERIRREIGTIPPPAAPAPPPPQPIPVAPRDNADGPTADVAPAVAPTPPVTVPAPADVPTITAGVGVEDAASTTVRWEPRQRLTTAPPITDTAVIAPHTSPGLDRTKVAIAIIVAVALVVIVWLVAGSLGGDDAPAPTVSVPTSDVATTGDDGGAPATTIAASDDGG